MSYVIRTRFENGETDRKVFQNATEASIFTRPYIVAYARVMLTTLPTVTSPR
jgi:hypothetical protein